MAGVRRSLGSVRPNPFAVSTTSVCRRRASRFTRNSFPASPTSHSALGTMRSTLGLSGHSRSASRTIPRARRSRRGLVGGFRRWAGANAGRQCREPRRATTRSARLRFQVRVARPLSGRQSCFSWAKVGNGERLERLRVRGDDAARLLEEGEDGIAGRRQSLGLDLRELRHTRARRCHEPESSV